MNRNGRGRVENSIIDLREIYTERKIYQRYVIEIQTEHEGVLYLQFDENNHIKYTIYDDMAARFGCKPKRYEIYKKIILREYPNSIIGIKTITIRNK